MFLHLIKPTNASRAIEFNLRPASKLDKELISLDVSQPVKVLSPSNRKGAVDLKDLSLFEKVITGLDLFSKYQRLGSVVVYKLIEMLLARSWFPTEPDKLMFLCDFYAYTHHRPDYQKREQLALDSVRIISQMDMDGQKSINYKWSLHRLKREHDYLAKKQITDDFMLDYGHKLDTVLVGGDVIALFNQVEHEGYSFRLLTVPRDILDEAILMRNCVVSYVDAIERGEYLMYHVTKHDDPAYQATLGFSLEKWARTNNHGRFVDKYARLDQLEDIGRTFDDDTPDAECGRLQAYWLEDAINQIVKPAPPPPEVKDGGLEQNNKEVANLMFSYTQSYSRPFGDFLDSWIDVIMPANVFRVKEQHKKAKKAELAPHKYVATQAMYKPEQYSKESFQPYSNEDVYAIKKKEARNPGFTRTKLF